MLRFGQSNRYDAVRAREVKPFSAGNPLLSGLQAAGANLRRLVMEPRLGAGGPGRRRYGPRFRR